jgi:predicted O-methyltransferase YrrM
MRKSFKWILIGLLCLGIIVVIIRQYNIKVNNQKSISSIIDPLPVAFKDALISMYNRQDQMGSDGKMYKLDAAAKILPEQGMCLYNLCKKIKPNRTLEIGFANGYSTIFFLASIKSIGMGYHVAMDPFEISDWHGIGLKKVEELKMDSFFRFVPEYDLFGLPDLARAKQKFNVIFIDGDHRFDYIFLDFTLADYIIADNGYIIFHDLWMPSTKKVLKFIKNNRSDYEVQTDIFSPQMLVLKKIASDKRPWNFYSSF